MEVQLYVYDLSKGLAKQMSQAFLGTQIDAVYHTSIVFNGVEYFFGAGVQTCYPGGTHHGRPMEVIPMGRTEIPMEDILEYLESLKGTYTAESYDLFMHNCNNFSSDFAQFLVGKPIPDHITSLPQKVLETPFGQMLRPQLDRSMREFTQVSVPPSSVPPPNIRIRPGETNGSSKIASPPPGKVHNVTYLSELNRLLESAKKSCAVIFFTSATCPPCKICYPAYDELAAEAGNKAVLVKVDLSRAIDIGPAYRVRATPTFMSFLKGEKLEEWAGANVGKLLGNVRLLVQMAHPPHPHSNLRLQNLQRLHQKPNIYIKVPPLDKVISKLPADVAKDSCVLELREFIVKRTTNEAASAPLPPLPKLSSFIITSLKSMPPASLFPLIDLLRLAFVDPRVSGYFAEKDTTMIERILSYINELGEECPYALRITTLQLACNLFTSNLFPPQLLGTASLCTPLIQLVSSSLLDEAHTAVRVSAASLAFNIAAYNHAQRRTRKLEQKPENILPESAQVELIASILQAVAGENESKDVIKGSVFALGLMAYCYDSEGEVKDLLQALDAKAVLEAKKDMMNDNKDDRGLLREVIEVVS